MFPLIDIPFAPSGPILAVRHLDGDARPDVIRVVGQSFVIHRGTAPLTWDSGLIVPSPIPVDSAFVFDHEGDGDTDLLIIDRAVEDKEGNEGPATIMLLRNEGNLTFSAHGPWLTLPRALDVHPSDLDGNGIQDLVITTSITNDVCVMLAPAPGAYGEPVELVDPFTERFRGRAGDFNGDGSLDLAFTSGYDGQIITYLNTGDGSFGAPTIIETGYHLNIVAPLDLNNDGMFDLLFNADAGAPLRILLSDNGSFPGPELQAGPEGLRVWDLNLEDLENDGDPNLVLSGLSVHEGVRCVVLSHIGGTSFSLIASSSLTGEEAANRIDFDLDGLPDFYRAGKSLSIDRASARPVLSAPTGAGEFSPAEAFAVADFGTDGALDLIIGSGSDLMLFEGPLSEPLPPPAALGTVVAGPALLVPAWMNGDDLIDLLASDGEELTVYVQVDGALIPVGGPIDTSFVNHTLHPGDLDGDGDTDVTVASQSGSTVAFYVNDGTGQLNPAGDLLPLGSPGAVTLLDVNGDLASDLVQAHMFNSQLRVYLNSGIGSFSLAQTIPSVSSPTSVDTADFNQDGVLDVVVGSSSSHAAMIYHGDGVNGLSFSGLALLDTSTQRIQAEDLDRDGWIDLLSLVVPATTTESLAVAFCRNDGAGGYESARTFLVGSPSSGPDAVAPWAVGDLDGDGAPDLISLDTEWVRIQFNQCAAPALCTGDLDGSGGVGFADLLQILAAWGPCASCPADLDHDDLVGPSDLLIVFQAWGPCDP